jgi:hypothetical protein
MKTKLVPGWLRFFSKAALALPMIGFFSQALGSDYFKLYMADVVVQVLASFGTALIDTVVQALLYGAA